MTIEEARAELDKAIEFYGGCVKDGDTLEEKCHAEEIVDDAIDVLMLAVHVETCHLRHATGSIGGVVQTTECGQADWYCDQAPRRDA